MISLDRFLNLSFLKIYSEIQILHIFSINLIKLVTRKPKTIINQGQREYVISGVPGGVWSGLGQVGGPESGG